MVYTETISNQVHISLLKRSGAGRQVLLNDGDLGLLLVSNISKSCTKITIYNRVDHVQ